MCVPLCVWCARLCARARSRSARGSPLFEAPVPGTFVRGEKLVSVWGLRGATAGERKLERKEATEGATEKADTEGATEPVIAP